MCVAVVVVVVGTCCLFRLDDWSALPPESRAGKGEPVVIDDNDDDEEGVTEFRFG